MSNLWPLLAEYKPFVFYSVVFITLLLMKKLFLPTKRIILNGIWFSEDGSVDANAISNLIRIAKKIRKSRYKKFYQLYLWTDKNRLDSKVGKALSRQGIFIKDYRDVHPEDKASRIINEYVDQFVTMGNQENRYFYCLASDLFRFYLLFKEFPENYPNAVTAYVDCGDIDLLSIPSPGVFRGLTVAFNCMYIKYTHILREMIGYEIEPQLYLNNDVMLVSNRHNKPMLDAIFTVYFNNLMELDRQEQGLIEKLKLTRDSIQVQDRNLAVAIVFAITHLTTLFRMKENMDPVFVFEHLAQGIKLEKTHSIQSAAFFLDFVREHEKGLSWGQDTRKEAPPVSQSAQDYRKYWYDLYARRYHSISGVLDDAIAAANVAWF